MLVWTKNPCAEHVCCVPDAPYIGQVSGGIGHVLKNHANDDRRSLTLIPSSILWYILRFDWGNRTTSEIMYREPSIEKTERTFGTIASAFCCFRDSSVTGVPAIAADAVAAGGAACLDKLASVLFRRRIDQIFFPAAAADIEANPLRFGVPMAMERRKMWYFGSCRLSLSEASKRVYCFIDFINWLLQWEKEATAMSRRAFLRAVSGFFRRHRQKNVTRLNINERLC